MLASGRNVLLNVRASDGMVGRRGRMGFAAGYIVARAAAVAAVV
jgi:hypothetical protein